MNQLEEDDFLKIIEQMDSEDLIDFLDEIPEHKDIQIPNKIKENIKKKTFQKLGLIPGQKGIIKNLRFALVASLLILLLGSTWIGPDNVWAKLKQALHFIPGMGMVVEKEAGMNTYVLSKPIEQITPDGRIKIKGLIIDAKTAFIMMEGNTLPNYKDKNIFFTNAKGEQFKIDSYHYSGGSDQWYVGGYVHRGPIKNIKGLAIILPDEAKTTISVPLEKAKLFKNYEEMGPSATVNGISITAIVTQENNKTKIDLVSPPMGGMRIDSYATNPLSRKKEMTLKDKNNKNYPFLEGSGVSTSPRREFYFDTEGATEKDFQLSVPYIGVIYDDKKTVKFSIPAKGAAKLNQTIELAGFPIGFEKIERIDQETVKIYVNVHYDKGAAESLNYFTLEEMSYSGELDEKTGALKELKFKVNPSQKSIKLHLKDPLVIKRGPWEFKIKK